MAFGVVDADGMVGGWLKVLYDADVAASVSGGGEEGGKELVVGYGL